LEDLRTLYEYQEQIEDSDMTIDYNNNNNSSLFIIRKDFDGQIIIYISTILTNINRHRPTALYTDPLHPQSTQNFILRDLTQKQKQNYYVLVKIF